MYNNNCHILGKNSVEGNAKIDPATLFAMIFGSEKFFPLVGNTFL